MTQQKGIFIPDQDPNLYQDDERDPDQILRDMGLAPKAAPVPAPPVAGRGTGFSLKQAQENFPAALRVGAPALGAVASMASGNPLPMLIAGTVAPAAAQATEMVQGKRHGANIPAYLVEAGANDAMLPGINRIPNPVLRWGARAAEGGLINAGATAGLAYTEQNRWPTWEEIKHSGELGMAIGGAVGSTEVVPWLISHIRGRRAELATPKPGVPPPPEGGAAAAGVSPKGDITLPPEPAGEAAIQPATPEAAPRRVKGARKAPKAAQAPEVTPGVPEPPTTAGAPPAAATEAAKVDPIKTISDRQLSSAIDDLTTYAAANPEDTEVAQRLQQLTIERETRKVLNSPAPAAPRAETPSSQVTPAPEVAGSAPGAAVEPAGKGAEIKASPAAMSLAKARGIDLTTVKGTGKGGLIRASDVQGALLEQRMARDEAAFKRDMGGSEGKKLPQELAGAKPRYRIGATEYNPAFKSDIDRAAYILAQGTKSKRDADYLKFVMDATGLDEAGARAYGKQVRSRLKVAAQGQPEGGDISLKKGQYGFATPRLMRGMAGASIGALAPAGDEKEGVNWKRRAVQGMLGFLAGAALPAGEPGAGRPRWTPSEEINAINERVGPIPEAPRPQEHDVTPLPAENPEYKQLEARLRGLDKPVEEWTDIDQKQFDNLYKEYGFGSTNPKRQQLDDLAKQLERMRDAGIDTKDPAYRDVEREFDALWRSGEWRDTEPSGSPEAVPPTPEELDRIQGGSEDLPYGVREFDGDFTKITDPEDIKQILNDLSYDPAIDPKDYERLRALGEAELQRRQGAPEADQPLWQGSETANTARLRQGLEDAANHDSIEGMALRQVMHDNNLTPDHISLMGEDELRGLEDEWLNKLDELDNNDAELGSVTPRAAYSLAGAGVGALAGYYSTDDPDLRVMRATLGAIAGAGIGHYLGGFPVARAAATAELQRSIAHYDAEGALTPAQLARVRAGKPLSKPGTPKKAGALNLENYDTDVDTKRLIKAAYQSIKKEVDAHRQIGVPMRVVESKAVEAARAAGLTPGDLKRFLKQKPEGMEDAIYLRSLTLLHLGASEAMAKTATAVAANPNDALALSHYYQAFLRYLDIHRGTQMAVSQTARALRAMANVAKGVEISPTVMRLMDTMRQQASPEVANEIAEKIVALQAKGATTNEINHYLTWTTGAKTADQLHLLYTGMLVLRATTQVANTIGNMANFARMGMEIPLKGMTDSAINRLTKVVGKERPRSRFVGELGPALQGLGAGWHSAAAAFGDVWRTGQSSFERGITSEVFAGKGQAFQIAPAPGDPLWWPTIGLRGMQAADDFAKTLIHSVALHQLAYRRARVEGLEGLAATKRAMEFVGEPDEILNGLARDEAHYYTFTSPLGKIGNAVGDLRRKFAVVRWIIPFFRTDVNLFKQALELSPVGLGKTGIQALRGKYDVPLDVSIPREAGGNAAFAHVDPRTGSISGGVNDIGKLTDDLTRGIIGSAAVAGAWWLVTHGFLTGSSPADPGERMLWRTKHIQPYSFWVPGLGWRAYDRIQPVGTAVGMAADWAQLAPAYKEGGWQQLMSSAGSAIRNQLLNRALVMGMLTMSRSISEETGLATASSRLASGFVPGPVANVNNVVDPTRREIERNWSGVPEAIKAHIPGMSQDLAAQRDAFGLPIKDPRTALERFASPITGGPEIDDPVLNFMQAHKLYTTSPSGKTAVDYNKNPMDEEPKVQLTLEERGVFEEAKGWAKYDAAKHLITDPSFVRAPEREQQRRWRAALSRASTFVTRQANHYKTAGTPFSIKILTNALPPPDYAQSVGVPPPPQ